MRTASEQGEPRNPTRCRPNPLTRTADQTVESNICHHALLSLGVLLAPTVVAAGQLTPPSCNAPG
jgi:hypothetical protein